MAIDWLYRYLLRSVIPSLDEIEFIRPIASGLRGSSDIETLGNVSEWLVKNVAPHSFRVFCISLEWITWFVCGMTLFFFYEYICRGILSFPDPIYTAIVIVLAISTALGLNIALYWLNTLAKIVIIFIIVVIIGGFVGSDLDAPILLYSGALLGALIALLFYSFYISTPTTLNRGVIGMAKTHLNFLISSCRSGMRVEEILRYGMGVCREYSKLVLSLLINLYPNNRILLFFAYPIHIATGIELGDKMYVFEPGLPLLLPKTWLKMTGLNEAKIFEVVKTPHRLTVRYIGRVAEKGTGLANEWGSLLEKTVKEIENAVRVGIPRVVIGLETLAKHLDLGDRVIAESIQRIVKTYVYSKALESYLRYVKDIRVIYTEAEPSIEILLAIPGKSP